MSEGKERKGEEGVMNEGISAINGGKARPLLDNDTFIMCVYAYLSIM